MLVSAYIDRLTIPSVDTSPDADKRLLEYGVGGGPVSDHIVVRQEGTTRSDGDLFLEPAGQGLYMVAFEGCLTRLGPLATRAARIARNRFVHEVRRSTCLPT